jgi:hypothetical protein
MVHHKSYMAEKHDTHHFHSAWTLSYNFIPCQCQGIPFCTLTLQFWIRWVHLQLNCCQNVTREILLLAPSIRENVQKPTAQVWHTNFHSACVESTLHRPSSCSVSKQTHCLQIFPFLLQLLCTSGCSLLLAQHKHAPHLSSIVVVSIPL